MRFLLNLIWFLFGGLWLAFGYFVAGILACILIVTIPVGIASFRMARYVLWPFGKTVEPKPGAGAGSAIMNGIWFVIAGWWLALAHIATAIAQYFKLGLENKTDNQFKKRNFSTTWGMLLLIVAEVGGVGMLLFGFIATQFLGWPLA